MSVYVDDPIWPFGRMMMCHMIADSREELDAMADRIGVARKWIQYGGTPKEHYDVCKSKRALAVRAGAVEVPSLEMCRWKWGTARTAQAAGTPDAEGGTET